MRIDIIGGGAIGLLYAAKLAWSGEEVTVWTRTEKQSDQISRRGISLLHVEEKQSARTVAVSSEWLHAKRLSTDKLGNLSWVLLAVKQTAINDELLHLLRTMAQMACGGISIVCLQNGIGHLEKLRRALIGTPIYAAVTTEGARREDERTVIHTGMGELWISEKAEDGYNYDVRRASLQNLLLPTLNKAGFRTFLSNEMENRIYQKLLINAVINPLTALFNVVNGELPNDERRLKWMRALHNETKLILLSAGMKDTGDSWNRLLDVCRLTSGNVSSMLTDVRAGRETEIEAISGAITKLAARYGMPSPLNQAMAALIEACEPKPEGEGAEHGRNLGWR